MVPIPPRWGLSSERLSYHLKLTQARWEERAGKCLLAFVFRGNQVLFYKPGGVGGVSVTNRRQVETDGALFVPQAGPGADGAPRLMASGGPFWGAPKGAPTEGEWGEGGPAKDTLQGRCACLTRGPSCSRAGRSPRQGAWWGGEVWEPGRRVPPGSRPESLSSLVDTICSLRALAGCPVPALTTYTLCENSDFSVILKYLKRNSVIGS